MKTVTGKLVSTKPISLSNAAKYVSRFVASDNGASTPISIYLQRTSDAFTELVQFHKKLKGSHSNREEHESQPIGIDSKTEHSADGAVEKKKKKKKSGKKGENEVPVERGLEGQKADEEVVDTIVEEIKHKSLEVEGDMKKEKKKKRKKGEDKAVVEDGKVDGGEKDSKPNAGSVQIKPEIMEDGGIVGTEGVGAQKRDKKKKKRKEDEAEESFGSPVKRGNEADGNNNTKQLNVEFKEEEIDRVAEGSVELSDKKKNNKKKGEAGDVERLNEEGKKRKSREVDGEETIDSAEQSGKKKKKRRRIEGDGS